MVADVIVVGAGIWGAAAVEAYQNAGQSVIWIDDNDDKRPTAASDDITRIIRAEYSDPEYRRLAERSLQAFKTQEPYSTYFHQTGWFLVQNGEQARHGSIPSGTENVSMEEFQRKFPAANVDDLFITKTDNVGWVEANNLQRDLNERACVDKRTGTVTNLIFDGPFCRGVRLGREAIPGETVVLAAGWRTNILLTSENLPLVDYRIVGVPVLGIQLSEEQYMKYQDMPILCQPGKGEILPPTPRRIMRINNPRSFSFDLSTAAPATPLPPTHHCFKESWDFLEVYLPDLRDCPAAISKICWDAFTDSQSFYIRQVEGTKNVYCIGGGSFHSWKFRPVLPGLIATRLGLKVGHESQELWESLTREQSKKHADLIPVRHWRYDNYQG